MAPELPDDDYEEEGLLRWIGRKAVVWWITFLASAGVSILLHNLGAEVFFMALAPLVGWSLISATFWTRQFRELEKSRKPPAPAEPPPLTKSCLRKKD